MKRRFTAAILGLAATAGAAGLAIAQASWTTVTKADLGICSPVFGEVQRIEHAWLDGRIATACQEGGAGYDAIACAELQRDLAASKAMDPLDWFYEGNDACSDASDYPCFGPSIYNTPRSGRDANVWTTTFVNDAGRPTHITGDMTFKDAAVEGDRCIAQVWVKKYRAAGGNAPPPVVAAPAPKRNPDVVACIDGADPSPERLAKCDAVLAALKADDEDYGSLAVALMQMNADAGRRSDALRYGDLVAVGKPEAEAAMTRCAVRVIVKWDLDAGMAACKAAGESHPPAVEAAGQIHLLAGRWQDAWAAFDKAHGISGAGQPLYLRGVAAAGLGKMGEALKDMADGEAKAPGSAQAYDRDGFSIAAVSQGKPLAPPEAFAPVAAALAGAPAPAAEPPAAPQPAAAPPPAPTPVSLPAPPPPAPAVAAPPPSASSFMRFDPDAPRPTIAGLTPVQSQACEDEIRALQEGSKSWQGTLDEISLKLSMLQRTLYASRCAGHPQAASLVTSAERLIADYGPRAAAAQTTAEQTTPVVTDCLEPIPTGGSGNTTNSSIFRNTCAYPVMVAYCNVAPAANSWAEAFACEVRSNIALVSVPASGFAPAVFGRQINHFACRSPALPVASYAPATGLSGFCK